jgi:hypothetical protein
VCSAVVGLATRHLNDEGPNDKKQQRRNKLPLRSDLRNNFNPRLYLVASFEHTRSAPAVLDAVISARLRRLVAAIEFAPLAATVGSAEKRAAHRRLRATLERTALTTPMGGTE